MEEIVISDGSARSVFVTYLYNALAGEVYAGGGSGELRFSEDRCVLRLRTGGNGNAVKKLLRDKAAEVLGIGYKYSFLQEKLRASLGKREKKLLASALIAADLEGDMRYIREQLAGGGELCLDGVYNFRLKFLREKWTRIVEYVPLAFSSGDLIKFCEFLAGESKHKIYVKGNAVFAENFTLLRRSRLTGEEDVETEIMLSDAGCVTVLGEVDESVENFLQKYYPERAFFS